LNGVNLQLTFDNTSDVEEADSKSGNDVDLGDDLD
jgi:hypothetical protein